MKSLSRIISLGLLCFTAACGGAPVDETATDLETTEQRSRPCSFDSQCPSTQTCVAGTCLVACDPGEPSTCGGEQCCPGYVTENGNQSKPYCALICFG
ncbi:hypothetical protein [Myxococcus sp. Y35]|uniref:hypothetical protein n=1 Tax=Pseudomyxococcus flavus TaxID=3115648 RepID=UPI003CEB9131